MALIIVNTGIDDVANNGFTSLREALEIAAGTAGADTIIFDASVTRVDLGVGGPLTIAAGQDVTIVGDRTGDGVADVMIHGNSQTSHFVVQAGATASMVSLNFVAGVGIGASGDYGGAGGPGSNGGYYYGADGGSGGAGVNGGDGTDGASSAGSIMNYGTLSLIRSQFAGNAGYGGGGGGGGGGGSGGYGGSGGTGGYGTGSNGGNGGNGGDGGNGGNAGDGGHGAGAIFNGAGATLNLTDTGFGQYLNTAASFWGPGGYSYGTPNYGSNRGNGTYGGGGGSGGNGGTGGTGGQGGTGIYSPGYYTPGYYVGDPGYGGYYVPPVWHPGYSGPGGNGGNGGNGGAGGFGGQGGNSGSGAGAILNLGTINTTTTQSLMTGGNLGQAPGYGGGGGTGGNGGPGGSYGFGGFGTYTNGLNGYSGSYGGMGLNGSPGSGGFSTSGILNLDSGTSAVAAADVIYYLYSPVTSVTEGNSGTTSLTFYVNRMGNPWETQTVSWSIASASGTLTGADFAGGVLPSGNLVFTAAANQIAVTIQIAGDMAAELSEIFTINLTGVTDTAGGLTHGLGTSSASITIVNDDPLVARYSSSTFGTLVQNYTANNAFQQAVSAATAGQAIDVLAEAVLGNAGTANATANNLTIRADTGFTATINMSGSAASLLLQGTANISVNGNTAVANSIGGNSGNNVLTGRGLNDLLAGNAGNDTLVGGGGNDTLRGGQGVDSMTGGAGNDVFDFNAVADIGMALGSRDIITDFAPGQDVLDFDDIDALTTLAGVQHFTWLGTAAHTGAGATLRYLQAGGNTLLYADVDANGTADFTLQLNGLINLTAADFTDLTIAAVQGTAAGETLAGSNGSELMIGLGGNDGLNALGGADTIRGGDGWDTMTGGAGADRFDFNSAAEIGMAINQRDVVTDFTQGEDLIDLIDLDANTLLAGNQSFTWLGTGAHTGAGATLRYQQVGANTLIYGDVNADGAGDFTIQLTGLYNLTAADFAGTSINAIQGGNGNDVLTGAPGGKIMLGLNGNDTITGGTGADTLWGGAGADSMTGGLGADQFKWNNATHSGNAVGTRDIITDFQQGVDKLDLAGVDANSNVAGDQAFTWLGTAVHTGAGATLRYLQAGGNTLIYGDINGDKAADFTIQLTGLYALTAADFVL